MDPIPTKVEDFLDEDPVIRGQNYVCLSFVSPEDILKTKDVFFAEKYIEKFAQDMEKIFQDTKTSNPAVHSVLSNLKESHSHLFNPQDVIADFQVFKQIKQYDLDKEFHEQNQYRTSVRGIKVRGVFDTVQEAKNRAEFLKKNGDKFDIFIGQVGCWCPWSPNPEDISESEYAETQLNTFMKQFKENMALKDAMFEERKSKHIQSAASTSKTEESQPAVSSIAESLTQEDPWMSAKKEVSNDM
jgi:hypothetical protein